MASERDSLRDALDLSERIDQFADVHFESVDLRIIKAPAPAARVEAGITAAASSHFVAYSIKSNYNT